MESTAPSKEKLVASDKAPIKMVRVRALREFKLTQDGAVLKPVQLDPKDLKKVLRAADEVEVTEEKADELCSKYPSAYGFSGQRPQDESIRHNIVLAERVNKSA